MRGIHANGGIIIKSLGKTVRFQYANGLSISGQIVASCIKDGLLLGRSDELMDNNHQSYELSAYGKSFV